MITSYTNWARTNFSKNILFIDYLWATTSNKKQAVIKTLKQQLRDTVHQWKGEQKKTTIKQSTSATNKDTTSHIDHVSTMWPRTYWFVSEEATASYHLMRVLLSCHLNSAPSNLRWSRRGRNRPGYCVPRFHALKGGKAYIKFINDTEIPFGYTLKKLYSESNRF